MTHDKKETIENLIRYYGTITYLLRVHDSLVDTPIFKHELKKLMKQLEKVLVKKGNELFDAEFSGTSQEKPYIILVEEIADSIENYLNEIELVENGVKIP